jgi:hypothetical protein
MAKTRASNQRPPAAPPSLRKVAQKMADVNLDQETRNFLQLEGAMLYYGTLLSNCLKIGQEPSSELL